MASTINAKNTSTGVVITPDASGQLELQTADTTRMTIDVNGNVGIGTNSPTFKISSTGDIVAGFGNNAGGGGGLISQGSVTTGALGANSVFLDNDGTGLARLRSYGTNTSTYGAFVFQGATSNNTQAERMRIDGNGNVSITQAAGRYTVDTSGGATSIANNGTVDFANASGMLIVNNHNSGNITVYLCGGGLVTVVSSAGSQVGTFTYVAGIAGYRWTNNSGSTATFGFFFVRTRQSA